MYGAFICKNQNIKTYSAYWVSYIFSILAQVSDQFRFNLIFFVAMFSKEVLIRFLICQGLIYQFQDIFVLFLIQF